MLRDCNMHRFKLCLFCAVPVEELSICLYARNKMTMDFLVMNNTRHSKVLLKHLQKQAVHWMTQHKLS